MFMVEELVVFVIGVCMFEIWGGVCFVSGVCLVFVKIVLVMLVDKCMVFDCLFVFVLLFYIDEMFCVKVDVIYQVIDMCYIVSFDYCDWFGVYLQCCVWLFGFVYWGGCWMIGVWCELCDDFCIFDIVWMGDIIVYEQFLDMEGWWIVDYMWIVEVLMC